MTTRKYHNYSSPAISSLYSSGERPNAAKRLHIPNDETQKAYCGRATTSVRPLAFADMPDEATCAKCLRYYELENT